MEMCTGTMTDTRKAPEVLCDVVIRSNGVGAIMSLDVCEEDGMASQHRYDTFKDDKSSAYHGNTKSAGSGRDSSAMMLVGDRKENMDENSHLSQAERDQLLGSVIDDDAVSNGSGRDGDDGAASTAFGAGSSRRDNGIVLTALLILNYMIGAGIINAPQVRTRKPQYLYTYHTYQQ